MPRLAPVALSLLAGSLALACASKPAPVDPPTTPPEPVAQAAEEATWPEEPFRAAQPAAGELPPLALPKLEQFTLANGMEVYLVHQDRLPTVYMRVEFDLGEVDDPQRKVGMTSLCMDLLDEGTKRLDKAAFEARQADFAVNVWSSGGDETSTVGLRALKPQLGDALGLLAEMLREPGLRAEDLTRLRDQEKASLAQARGTPATIARRVYPSLTWGAKHPYGRLTSEATLDAVGLGDCKRVAGKLRPAGARLFVVGQVTRAELEQAFDSALGFWKGKAPKAAQIPAARPESGTVFLIDAPGAAQSVISVGVPGPDRDAPDYTSTQMMAQILGGSFSSRINMNLREDKGYSYGGRGGFRYYRNGSHFSAGSSVRTHATGPAVREIANEIAGMREREATPEELRREKEGAILALPAKFSTPTRTLFSYQELIFHGLPLSWYDAYQREVPQVEAGNVEEVARRYLPATGYVVLVVGDAQLIRADLQKIADERVFGDGGLVELDADGQRVDGKGAAKPAKAAAK
ncbi:MAG: pitrilysin family protein [Nannocystaceae bacterium]